MAAKIIAVIGTILYFIFLLNSISLTPNEHVTESGILLTRFAFAVGMASNFFYWQYLHTHKKGRTASKDSIIGVLLFVFPLLFQFILLFLTAPTKRIAL